MSRVSCDVLQAEMSHLVSRRKLWRLSIGAGRGWVLIRPITAGLRSRWAEWRRSRRKWADDRVLSQRWTGSQTSQSLHFLIINILHTRLCGTLKQGDIINKHPEIQTDGMKIKVVEALNKILKKSEESAPTEVWSCERRSSGAWEGRREKTGSDNEGGIESDEPSSALKLSISSGPRWTNSPQQLLRVDTPAVLSDSKVRRVLFI